ncbi:MAG: LLM class flavin-dependent oxidoreductase [Thermomicrobiales bacterium]
MVNARRFRLGFFTYLEGEKPQAEIYAEALELFIAADQLGFDMGWVAQHHFGHHGGLPSPFMFFTALAERTRQIGLGTAVITLPLEDPIRVAEDAAVFESLHPGRLHLGLGTGLATPQTMATFDRVAEDRRTLYDTGIERLIAAIDGQALNEDGDVLNPPAPELRSRIWEAPGSPERVAEASRRGSGLLLSRVASGAGNQRTPEIQIPFVNRYLQELPLGVAPRIGLSRTVYPSRDPETLFRQLSVGIDASLQNTTQHELIRDKLTMPERFVHFNIHCGTPEAVIASIEHEPLLNQITDLICQLSPALPSFAQALEAIELLATEVAPALGWTPARTSAEVAIR